MTDRLLRSAVVGAGFVGPHHVDAVRRGGYAAVVALAGSDQARTEARARQLGVAVGTADLGALLADASIDVIHVCTPNATHMEIASRALEAGKHVVVEKPVAPTAGAARELAHLAAERGRHAAVAFTYRGYPMIRRARELVASGELGEIRLVLGSYLQDWLLEAADYNWRLESSLGGASRAVADIGSHWFDTTEFVTGRRIESVLADLSTFIPLRQRPKGGATTFQAGGADTETVRIDTEDAAGMLVRFDGGARGVCLVSQVSPGRKNDFRLELSGSRRSLAWAQEEPNTLWLGARSDRSAVIPREPWEGAEAELGTPSLPPGHPEGWSEALRDLFRPFYRAIAEGEAPPSPGESAVYPTLDDGTRAVAFVEAVLQSAREGRWTPVEQH